MDYNESVGSILSVPQGYYLAHCISADFTLGAGLALNIDRNYNMREKLESFYNMGNGQYSYVGRALLVDNVFNLVTKETYKDKPTYEDLRSAIEDMAVQMDELHVKKLAIPLLGCGRDHLDWETVKDIIFEVFEEKDVEISVRKLNPR